MGGYGLDFHFASQLTLYWSSQNGELLIYSKANQPDFLAQAYRAVYALSFHENMQTV